MQTSGKSLHLIFLSFEIFDCFYVLKHFEDISIQFCCEVGGGIFGPYVVFWSEVVQDDHDWDVGVEDDGQSPAEEEGDNDAADGHAETGEHAGQTLNEGVLCPLGLHVHISANFLRFVFIIPLQFLLEQGFVVEFTEFDELSLAGDGPGDIHEGAADEDEDAVEEESMGGVGDAVDLFLEVVAGFIGVDEIFEGSCVENHGEAVGDWEDRAQQHQDLVPLIGEADQISEAAGGHFFVLLLVVGVCGVSTGVSLGILSLSVNELLHPGKKNYISTLITRLLNGVEPKVLGGKWSGFFYLYFGLGEARGQKSWWGYDYFFLIVFYGLSVCW